MTEKAAIAIAAFGLVVCAFNVWVAWLYERDMRRVGETLRSVSDDLSGE